MLSHRGTDDFRDESFREFRMIGYCSRTSAEEFVALIRGDLDAEGMLRGGREYAGIAPNVIIKCPLTRDSSSFWAGGYTAAQTLREDGFKGRVLMITREDRAPYDRPNLSKDYLQGHAEPEAAAHGRVLCGARHRTLVRKRGRTR